MDFPKHIHVYLHVIQTTDNFEVKLLVFKTSN